MEIFNIYTVISITALILVLSVPFSGYAEFTDFSQPYPDHLYELCFDGIDNDGDGRLDLDDPDCPRCFDGIDNDADNLIDSADPDCPSGEVLGASTSAKTEDTETTPRPEASLREAELNSIADLKNIANLNDNADLRSSARLRSKANLDDSANLNSNANLNSDVSLSNSAKLSGNAKLRSNVHLSSPCGCYDSYVYFRF